MKYLNEKRRKNKYNYKISNGVSQMGTALNTNSNRTVFLVRILTLTILNYQFCLKNIQNNLTKSQVRCHVAYDRNEYECINIYFKSIIR